MSGLSCLSLIPIEGRNGAGFQKRENDMKYQFNMAALAKLSKQELLVLKVNLIAQFHSASFSAEKSVIQSNIRIIDMSLTQK